jgi:hypothetical protein
LMISGLLRTKHSFNFQCTKVNCKRMKKLMRIERNLNQNKLQNI